MVIWFNESLDANKMLGIWRKYFSSHRYEMDIENSDILVVQAMNPWKLGDDC